MGEKKLLLLRHAKSDWNASHGSDFDRPLNLRGQKAAPLIGNYAKENHHVPDIIYCSAAVRTHQTCDLFVKALDQNAPGIDVIFKDNLYGADTGTYNDLIRQTDDGITSVMIIGHNPTIGTMVYNLAPDKARLFGKYPTASLSVFGYAGDHWQDFNHGPCDFFDFVKPADLA